jgi:DNA-binding MurR/RpiR family transcriptional regulator
MLSSLIRSRPGTYEELLAVLSASSGSLPKRLRQVAVFVTQHPNEMALESISSVARQIGVQPSTLVRFAQIFGYTGFSEFQDLFKAHLKAGRTGGKDADGPIVARDAGDHPLSGLIASGMASLSRVGTDIDGASFMKAAAVLAKARHIHVVGSKRAFAVAHYIALTLSQHGVANSLVGNVGSSAFDEISCIHPDDAVLAISFSPYNSITPELAAMARQRSAALVAITDSTMSPLIELSHAHLIVVEHAEGGYRTLSATMVVGLGLAIEIAKARRAPAPTPMDRKRKRTA